MRDDRALILACMGVGALFGAFVSWGLTKIGDNYYWQDMLVARGHAHYYLDAENQRQWNWIKPQKVEAKP